MNNRNYNQACSLAVAMDLIGERWTWLIVRALLTGPKRYGELVDQLPGIGTNLLAERLKRLSETAIIEKPKGGRQAAYRLTETGEALRPITHELIRWGWNFPEEISSQAISRPEWDMLAIEAAFEPGKAKGIDTVLELTLSGFTFHLVIRKQECRAVTGPAVAPDVQVISNSKTLQAIANKAITSKKAQRDGQLNIKGSQEAFNHLFNLFGKTREGKLKPPIASASETQHQ